MAPCVLGYPANGGGWNLGFYLGATFQWKPKFQMKMAPHASSSASPRRHGGLLCHPENDKALTLTKCSKLMTSFLATEVLNTSTQLRVFLKEKRELIFSDNKVAPC